MFDDIQATPKILQLYLELSQYPILARRIRQRMREELFNRGVVMPRVFEEEVRAKAIQSQEREGITDPVAQEPADTWQARLERIRDDLTDFYFAYNLPHDLFRDIVQEVVGQRAPDRPVILSFNPELAPWDLLFAQGEAYEKAPPGERAAVAHHLREIIVVLIKTMISDQLAFVRLAREYLTIADLKEIRSHRIGRGKIGGKAAGMLLASKIIHRQARQRGLDLGRRVSIPDSYFLGADVFYDFHTANDLFRFMNQKYKSFELMAADYPLSYEAYVNSRLPDYVLEELGELLGQVGDAPLIVRSSSLLEDNFDTSFAGKYDSFFLPNQGTQAQNLEALMEAIIRVYASVARPEALIYRDQMGLVDYDERMAILIQKVEGQRYGRYFFPPLAGVAFSHNPYRWNKRIRAEDGLVRLVAGLGTRAVDRVGSDYPRMVALSHPTLRPEQGPRMVRHYSQHHMDVLDLHDNDFKTLHVSEVLGRDYHALGAIMSLEQDGMIRPMSSRPVRLDPTQMVVTFDHLLAHEQGFVDLLRDTLHILEEVYGRPVDIEFAGRVSAVYPRPKVHLALLQCRPLSRSHPAQPPELPRHLPHEDVLFTASHQVPNGVVKDIRYVVFVDPRAYAGIADPQTRIEVGRVVGRLNHALGDQTFILMGPGRWGTSNIQLGVKVTYADIYHTRVLVEIAYTEGGGVPEVSYGTHFFQDLVEANIYPLPLYPDADGTVFREDFFLAAHNLLPKLLPQDAAYADYVRVIDIPAESKGRHLHIVMNGEEDKAVGYLAHSHK